MHKDRTLNTGRHPKLPEAESMTNNYTNEDSVVEKIRQQEVTIDGITFVEEQGGWKVFESGSWEEWRHSAEEYGTIAWNSDGFLAFNPNIGCFYPLGGELLQAIATFIIGKERQVREAWKAAQPKPM